MARTLLVAGTASHVGKSTVVASGAAGRCERESTAGRQSPFEAGAELVEAVPLSPPDTDVTSRNV